MIEPTVGRVVWYVGGEGDPLSKNNDQVLAAIVAYVHSDDLVNLMVIDADGATHPRLKVPLVQDGAREGSYCTWMPYQRGQAAKADALEQRIPQTPPLVPEQPADVTTTISPENPPGEQPADPPPPPTNPTARQTA